MKRFSTLTTILLFCASAVLLIVSCVPNKKDTNSNLNNEESEKVYWLSKASEAILSGETIEDDEKFEALLGLSKTDAVKELMEDPRFQDTMSSFLYWFLSQKRDGGSFFPQVDR